MTGTPYVQVSPIESHLGCSLFLTHPRMLDRVMLFTSQTPSIFVLSYGVLGNPSVTD